MSLASCIFSPPLIYENLLIIIAVNCGICSCVSLSIGGPVAKRFNDPFVHVDHVTDSP